MSKPHRLRREALPFVILLLSALLVVATLNTPGFFTLGNAQAVLTSMIFVGMVAVGMTLIMVSGAFVSLALATTATISAMVFMTLLPWGLPAAVITTLALAAATGAVQGVIIGGWNANPILVTIAAAAVLEGLAIWLSGGVTINPVGTGYRVLNERFFGLPVGLYVLIGLVLSGEIILRITVLGRMIYLAGDSRAAAQAAALP
jgi:simple sugar transport system permease protein/ribose transport system permease protein